MDWVHCNICYLQPGDRKGKKFELTSCGHIYCYECRKACVVDKCQICSSVCTMVELEAKMRADVQQFFDDPASALKKVLRIIEFQEGHRQRLTSHRRMMAAKFHAAKAEIYKLRKKIEELEKEIYLVRQQCTSMPVDACAFPRPSPPSKWNLTPRQHHAPQSKMSPLSPANSEGWVTPNRLTLKRTPSPSSRALSQPSAIQALAKQRKPPSNALGRNTPLKPAFPPKVHGSQAPNTSSKSNFRAYKGCLALPRTPLTPIHSSMSDLCNSRDLTTISPSLRASSYSLLRGSTPISSGSLLSNLKLTSPT